MISFSVVGLDGCRTSAFLNAYLDIVDEGGRVKVFQVDLKW